MGAVSGPLGACFGPLGGLFWASWGLLGASWGPLGASWGPLRALLGPPGAPGGGKLDFWIFLSRFLEASLPSYNTPGLFDACGSRPGCLSWSSGGTLGMSRAVLEAIWCDLETCLAVLGPSWGRLRGLSGRHGAMLESSWAISGASWAVLSRRGERSERQRTATQSGKRQQSAIRNSQQPTQGRIETHPEDRPSETPRAASPSW